MIVFNGVCIGLEDIFVAVDFTGSIGCALQQEIIIAVHTGNQASSQFRGIQRIHQDHLLPFSQ